jgi:acid phosphatase (class A)
MGTKKILTILFVFFAAIVSISAQKATYLTTEQLPNLIKCLPAPPAFDSPEFSNDIVRYAWGKQQRKDPKRAAIAKGDAIWDSIDSLFHQFAVPFGLEVTLEGTPEIYKLLTTAIYTIDQMRVAPKAHYKRQRPFERYDEPMLTGEEDNLRGEGSYPSGHALRGQTCALVMAQIAPENADTIFYRAHIYALSRVIAGAHWQSDVDASRNGATIGYIVLQNCPAFIEQMKKAQKEYRKIKKSK